MAWGIAFVINLFPAFMPPTWAVLAVFNILGHPPLLLLTIGGAAMSALGRAGLARLSSHLANRLPESDRKNAEALSAFVNRHRHWREIFVFLYCLGPFPSNPLFIAAGVGRIPLLPVTVTFFLSRCIADTFWVWTAGQVSKNVGHLFVQQVTDWRAIALQVGALAIVVLFFRLPWARWLGMQQKDNHDAGSATNQKTHPVRGKKVG
jgi:membrane protein YqaA with SNARE-associated domain